MAIDAARELEVDAVALTAHLVVLHAVVRRVPEVHAVPVPRLHARRCRGCRCRARGSRSTARGRSRRARRGTGCPSITAAGRLRDAERRAILHLAHARVRELEPAHRDRVGADHEDLARPLAVEPGPALADDREARAPARRPSARDRCRPARGSSRPGRGATASAAAWSNRRAARRRAPARRAPVRRARRIASATPAAQAHDRRERAPQCAPCASAALSARIARQVVTVPP